MLVSKFKKALDLLYTDSMDIYRHLEIVTDDGTTYTNPATIPLYQNVRCRISFNSSDASESSLEDRNPIRLSVKVFCGPETDLQKGDKLIIRRLDNSGNIMRSYKGIANLPLIYPTHKEAQLIEVGDA